MPQFDLYPAPVTPLTGTETVMLAQTQNGKPTTVTATVADINAGAAAAAPVQSVAGKTGDVVLTAANITDFSTAAPAVVWPTISNLPPPITASATDLLPIVQSDGQTHNITPSAMGILADGATAARTLAARLSDVVSIEDLGVVNDPNGQFIVENTKAYLEAIARVNGQARLRHRAGLSIVTTSLIAANPVVLEMDGTITLAPNTNGPVLRLYGAGNVIEGSGIIDGNKANQTSSGAGCAGINTETTSVMNVRLRGLTIQNCFNWPINLTNLTQADVELLTMLNSGNSCEFSNANNVRMRFCTVSGITDEGIALYGAVVNGMLFGNTISGCSASGISVLNDGAQPAPSSSLKIIANTISGSGLAGIEVDLGSGGSGADTHVQIKHNETFGNNTQNITARAEINLTNASIFNVSDNEIHDSIGNYAGGVGISGPAIQGNVCNNTITNIGSETGNSFGVLFSNSVTNLRVSGNSICDNRATPLMSDGVVSPSGIVSTGISVVYNTIKGMVNVNINVTPNADTTIIDEGTHEHIFVLPTINPGAGSGKWWNNGGVVTVA